MCPNGNADLTRSLIIQSAIEIISNEGLSALTAGKLIRQAKISKGGLYHHFRTMQEVELDVLDHLLEHLKLEINAYQDPDTKEGFLDLIEQEIFSHFVTDTKQSKGLFAFISEAANNPQIQVRLRSLVDEISMTRKRQLSAVSPGLSMATLSNTVQIICTMQVGLMTRYVISDDLVSLKNYWRGCRGSIAELIGAHVIESDDVVPSAEQRVTLEAVNFS